MRCSIPAAWSSPPVAILPGEAAEKSFVLLKNDGVLPLKPDAEVALIGPLADSAADMLGSWSGKGKDSDAVTLEAALSARLGPRLRRAKGTDILGASDAGFAEALAIARQSDVVVLALGEDAAKMTGEAASRSELDLPGNQEALLEAVAATGKPMVLVLFSGRPLVLDHASALAGAILAAWFPGVEAGPALVETLFGDSNPSGRLTASFPRAVGQEPLYYDQLSTGRPWPDQPDATLTGGAAKYKSRYIDQLNTPLYPFGYGLSYTSFAYGPVRVERLSYAAADLAAGTARIKVTAKVSNTGARAGTAVVQLYINQRGTSVARPVRELKGFRRVDLQAGAEAEVEFQLGRDELSFWNIDMKNVVEPGLLKIWIADIRAPGPRPKSRCNDSAEQLVDGDGSLAALGVRKAEVAELKPRITRVPHCGADQDGGAELLVQALQPRGDVHGVAHGGVLPPLLGAEAADDGDAGVNADPA